MIGSGLSEGSPPNTSGQMLGTPLTEAPRATVSPLLFGLRLWASVCLALYVAFWLELDNAVWAGTTAAIVCQPPSSRPRTHCRARARTRRKAQDIPRPT